ncbi:MAG: GNAT family N-acetyltransferase [Candidatus Diapherotrites archaeon]|nr:GNAT family N-acetyltransferase [Candidatus Diapherotrites archaeon]
MEIVQSNNTDLNEIVKTNYPIFKDICGKEPYSLSQYNARIKEKKPVFFVAKENHKLIGNTIAFEDNNSFYIWIIGVSKNKRNKGIGSKLLELNENYARKNGFESVTTKVYNFSTEMKKLLKKRGYTITRIDNAHNELYSANHYCLIFK